MSHPLPCNCLEKKARLSCQRVTVIVHWQRGELYFCYTDLADIVHMLLPK